MKTSGAISFLRPVHLLWGSYLILLVTIAVSIGHITFPWDMAVYVGMGKYIASNGHIGLWELYRPPLLPLVLSIGQLLHISIIWAQLLTIATAACSVFFIYRIGERMGNFVGGIAAMLFVCTALLTDFSYIATTEMFGVFFLLLTLYFWQRNNFLLVGLCSVLAFLLRFPYGLLLPIYGFFIALRVQKEFRKKFLAEYLLGIALPLLIFFAANALLYGGAFIPISEGQRVAHAVSALYQRPWWYYIGIIILAQPAVLFMTLAIRYGELRKKYALLLIISFVFLVYFTIEPHKEDRYIIPAIAPLLLFAAIGIRQFITNRARVLIVVLMLIGIVLVPYHALFRKTKDGSEGIYKDLPKGTVLESYTPFPAFYSDVKVIPKY